AGAGAGGRRAGRRARRPTATSDMGLFLLGPPGRLAGQGGGVAAEAAAGGERPAAAGRLAAGRLQLVEPAGTAGTLHRLLAVLDGAAADRTGDGPGAGLRPKQDNGRRRLAREIKPAAPDEDHLAVLEHAQSAEPTGAVDA